MFEALKKLSDMDWKTNREVLEDAVAVYTYDCIAREKSSNEIHGEIHRLVEKAICTAEYRNMLERNRE